MTKENAPKKKILSGHLFLKDPQFFFSEIFSRLMFSLSGYPPAPLRHSVRGFSNLAPQLGLTRYY
jgi:hypothetical protein